jgi:hypothetical protein
MEVELLSTWPLDERLKHLVDPGVTDFAVVTETLLLEMTDEGAGGEVVAADGLFLIGKHEYHGVPGVLVVEEPAVCTGPVKDGRFYLLEGVMVDRAEFKHDSITSPYVRHTIILLINYYNLNDAKKCNRKFVQCTCSRMFYLVL